MIVINTHKELENDTRKSIFTMFGKEGLISKHQINQISSKVNTTEFFYRFRPSTEISVDMDMTIMKFSNPIYYSDCNDTNIHIDNSLMEIGIDKARELICRRDINWKKIFNISQKKLNLFSNFVNSNFTETKFGILKEKLSQSNSDIRSFCHSLCFTDILSLEQIKFFTNDFSKEGFIYILDFNEIFRDNPFINHQLFPVFYSDDDMALTNATIISSYACQLIVDGFTPIQKRKYSLISNFFKNMELNVFPYTLKKGIRYFPEQEYRLIDNSKGRNKLCIHPKGVIFSDSLSQDLRACLLNRCNYYGITEILLYGKDGKIRTSEF